MDMESRFDQKILAEVTDEIMKESHWLSRSDMLATISKRYAQRIYAVEQFPTVHLNHRSTDERGYATKYTYSPLREESEIRLLRFEKFVSVGRDYYSCELIHANLDDNPIYLAISYAWGSVHDAHPILIGENRVLMVTKSLVEVLYRFSTTRSGTKPWIWTDQICIDQYNLQERSKQVAMMRRVYGQAENTIIWLGEEDQRVREAFDLIRCFSPVGPSLLLTDVLLNQGDYDFEEMCRRFHATFSPVVDVPPRNDPRWKALFHLLERPWFSRIWVFQEALGSDARRHALVYRGSLTCTVFHLYLARSFLYIDWRVSRPPLGLTMVSLLILYYVYRDLEVFPPLACTLCQVGGLLDCTDPRDRVYGLLGIQNLTEEVKIPIDYTKSVEHVCIDCTRRLIEHSQDLRALVFLQEGCSKRICDLPSWVLDWSAERTTSPILGVTESFSCGFNACKGMPYDQQESPTSRHLVVKGRKLDTIVSLIDHEFQIGYPDRIEEYLTVNFPVLDWERILERHIREGLVQYQSSEKLLSTITRTITTDGFTSTLLNYTTSDSAKRNDIGILKNTHLAKDHTSEYMREVQEMLSPPHEAPSQEQKELYRKVWLDTKICEGRKLAILGKHCLALGPSQAKRGDYICILHGSRVPWVLRPGSTESDTYEIVGQCFVHGAMYGEVVDWAEEDAHTFVLV